jgi:hypothetical protein
MVMMNLEKDLHFAVSVGFRLEQDIKQVVKGEIIICA